MLPEVRVVCLYADRPQFAARFLRSFRELRYDGSLRLLIYDNGVDPWPIADLDPQREFVRREQQYGMSIGQLRNLANSLANADVVVHGDVDDLSHPNRIAEQVALLESSGADAVGYNKCLFWHQDPEAAYLYRNPNPNYAIGSSLCYWRGAWKAKPFPDLMVGEDTAWIAGIKVRGVSAVSDLQPVPGPVLNLEPRMICSIHGGNTSPAYATLVAAPQCEQVRSQFARVPEWDSYCRERMAL